MEKKLKLPVIKRKGKWYNTLTGKYVSEAYAKRINNYFKHNPKGSLFKAGGHGKLDKKKALTEQSKYIRELAYRRDIQLIKTKTRRGKTVYIAPFQDERLTKLPKNIGKLDYWIIPNRVKVELYRMTRDRFGVYHIITWEVNRNFNTALALESWHIQNEIVYNKIQSEMKKIMRDYPFSKGTQIFGNIGYYVRSENTFYTDENDNKGIGFGFKFPVRLKYKTIKGKRIKQYTYDRASFQDMKTQFDSRINHFVSKLEGNAYMIFALTKITFYIYDLKKSLSKGAQNLAGYRIGIIRY